MIQFKQSPVVFDEESHEYSLDGKRLLGITGLIHSILGLGVYPEASDYTADYVIPRAGSRGTAVHHAIETYDRLGIEQPVQIVRTRYGCKERDNISYADEQWEVSAELAAYIRHLNDYGFEPLANELTVSDESKWASQIDNVWRRKETGGIWLVDTKTNNIALYPLCGYFVTDYFASGEEALKEYLSWQLSIYAELFERENPGVKVEGLACNWLRKDADELWEIVRKPSELVRELLSSDYLFTDNGAVYFHHDPTVFGIGKALPAKPEEKTPAIASDVVDYVTRVMQEYRDAEKKFNEAKTALKAAMEEHGIKSCDFDSFSATIAKDSMTATFDSKAFRKDNPELYEKYVTRKPKKGGFTIKMKE